jgi:sec-independent protein translocase protein TatA
MRPGLTEILLILGIALLLFGAGRLADIGKGLGEGIRNFKKGIKDDGGGDDDKPKEKLPEAKTEGDKSDG